MQTRKRVIQTVLGFRGDIETIRASGAGDLEVSLELQCETWILKIQSGQESVCVALGGKLTRPLLLSETLPEIVPD